MGLRLVSLALLLLALCRTSSGLSYSVVSKNTKSSSSAMSFTTSSQKSQITQAASGVTASVPDEQKIEKLLDLFGNTIFTLGFFKAGMIDKLPPSFVKSLVKGVQCEFGDKVKVIKAINDAQGRTRDQEVKDVAAAGGKCAPAATNPDELAVQKCFCKDESPMIYCILSPVYAGLNKMLEGKGVDLGPFCRPEAIAAFRSVAPKLWGEYDLDNFGNKRFIEYFNGDLDGVTKEGAEVFCEAINPAVETAVKNLYAADGMYWIAESLLYSIIFGAPEKPIKDICQENDFASNPYGQCVCQLETGFSFCIYKVFGQAFKEAGYITCDAEKKFVPEKKPAALPTLAHRGSPTAAAATSSLLLAPLAAAAAMLLRH